MAQLYVLLCGKSKSNMKPIMVDLEYKCKNYRDARLSSMHRKLHYKIVPAEKGAKVWRKDTTNQWTNYNATEPHYTAQKNSRMKKG